MGTNVWRCDHCKAIVSESMILCEKCEEGHKVAVTQETRIDLGDITYSRQTVLLSLNGIVLVIRGHLGRRAISCEYMPQGFQDRIREFVLELELAEAPVMKEID